jgi:hypothetical protein
MLHINGMTPLQLSILLFVPVLERRKLPEPNLAPSDALHCFPIIDLPAGAVRVLCCAASIHSGRTFFPSSESTESNRNKSRADLLAP